MARSKRDGSSRRSRGSAITRVLRLGLAAGLLLLTPFSLEAGPGGHGAHGSSLPSVSSAGPGGMPALDCVIEPDTTVAIGSRFEGILDTLHVERGEMVAAGQPVAELDAGLERAEVALARARADVEAQLRAKQENLSLGERRVSRNERLFENRAISLEAKDEGETNAVVAALDLEQARNQKRVAELELQRAQVKLHHRTITSPIDGVVVERMMAAGELVTDDPILSVARVDPLRVEVIVPAEHYGRIQRGMQAEIVPEAPLDGRRTAQVRIVDGVIDAASGTFGVQLERPNPDHAIPAGLGCKVQFSR